MQQCIVPSSVVNYIADHIENLNNNIIEALDESKNKIFLLMGHKMRARVQDARVEATMMEMKKEEPGTSAVVYIDYKMKLEPVRHRETTNQFYGKKGMSWNGCTVFYGTEDVCSS